jgi:hypothetical protein
MHRKLSIVFDVTTRGEKLVDAPFFFKKKDGGV